MNDTRVQVTGANIVGTLGKVDDFSQGDRVVDKDGDRGIVVGFVPMSMAVEQTMLVAYRSAESHLTYDVRGQTAKDITLEERAHYAAPERTLVEVTPDAAARLREIGEVLARLDHAPQQAAALGLSADAVDAFSDLLDAVGVDRRAEVAPAALDTDEKITKESIRAGDRVTSRSGKWGIVVRTDVDDDIIVTGGNATLIKLPNIVKLEHPTYGAEVALPAQPPRVIVEVSGGLVDAVFSASPLDVEILDHDNWECVSRDGEHAAKCEDHTEAEFEQYKALRREADRLDDRTVNPGYARREPEPPIIPASAAVFVPEPSDLRTGERVTGTVLDSSIDGHILYLDAGRGKVVSVHADTLGDDVTFPTAGEIVTVQRAGNDVTIVARNGAELDRGDE